MTYKDFNKIYIGESDISRLIVAGPDNVSFVHFWEDGAYSAYEVFGSDVEIGAHYKLQAEGKAWLKIYDDRGLVFYKHTCDFNGRYYSWKLYRSGNFGAIIQWIEKEG